MVPETVPRTHHRHAPPTGVLQPLGHRLRRTSAVNLGDSEPMTLLMGPRRLARLLLLVLALALGACSSSAHASKGPDRAAFNKFVVDVDGASATAQLDRVWTADQSECGDHRSAQLRVNARQVSLVRYLLATLDFACGYARARQEIDLIAASQRQQFISLLDDADRSYRSS